MNNRIIEKPPADEFQRNEPLLADLVADDGLLLEHFSAHFGQTSSFIMSIPSDRLLYRYAPDKWTIKEIMIHLIDMERIYGYRMLRFARNDQTVLAGFDDREYVRYSGANDRDIGDLVAEMGTVRSATVSLIKGLSDEALQRSGLMNGYPVSVRALAYHIAGHEVHHMKIIRERYLK
jgi:hypothetical protein